MMSQSTFELIENGFLVMVARSAAGCVFLCQTIQQIRIRFAYIWCTCFHHSLMWPHNGHYQCAKCHLVHEIRWEPRWERHMSISSGPQHDGVYHDRLTGMVNDWPPFFLDRYRMRATANINKTGARKPNVDIVWGQKRTRWQAGMLATSIRNRRMVRMG